MGMESDVLFESALQEEVNETEGEGEGGREVRRSSHDSRHQAK